MGVVVPVLGVAQILAWGSSYYLFAVLAEPIAGRTDWPLAWVVSGVSLGLLTAGLVSPRVGDSIERHGDRHVLATSAGLLAFGLVGLALAPSLPDLLRRRGGQCWLPLDEDGQTIAIERVVSMEPSTARPQRGSARPTALQVARCRSAGGNRRNSPLIL